MQLAAFFGGALEQLVGRLVDLAGASATNGNTLVHEHRGGELPTGVVLAEQMVLGDANVGKEHLVEMATAVDLVDWTNLDARCGHIEDEH